LTFGENIKAYCSSRTPESAPFPGAVALRMPSRRRKESRDSLFDRGMVIKAIVTILFETGSIHD
jgi:hypothetical protein